MGSYFTRNTVLKRSYFGLDKQDWFRYRYTIYNYVEEYNGRKYAYDITELKSG